MLPVLIIGCGISSLTLANVLLAKRVPFLIFEREGKLSHRHQGYRFRLHGKALRALQDVCEMNSPELWERCQASFALGIPPRVNVDAKTGKVTKVAAFNSNAVVTEEELRQFDHVNASDDRRHVHRAALRHVLLDNVREFVRLDSKFIKYEIKDGCNEITAHFEDGHQVTGSLLVGADGVRSKVARQLLPDVQLHDIGLMVIFGRTPCGKENLLPEELHDAMAYSSSRTNEGKVTVFTETIKFDEELRARYPDIPIPDDYIFFGVVGHKVFYRPDHFQNQDEIAAVNEMTSPQRADLLLHISRDFHPRIRAVLEQQDRNTATVGSLRTGDPYELPIWETDPRVTLLGDAYHASPPTASWGANLAVCSGRQLGIILGRDYHAAEAVGRWNASTLREFEDWMRAEAQPLLKEAYENAVIEFGAIPHPRYPSGEVVNDHRP